MILASHCTIALQVVAGILSILAPDYGEHLLLFMHPLNFEGRHLDFGFGEFLAVGGNGTQFRRLNSLVGYLPQPNHRVDAVWQHNLSLCNPMKEWLSETSGMPISTHLRAGTAGPAFPAVLSRSNKQS